MADPLLTSLCTICHVQSPKYKCPRCATKTCSLLCIKKHKKWSSCSGERDPTVYLPPSRLKTDAGIDHDYNFLTKIERSIETAEKILRDERDIIPPPGQQQQQQQQQQQHQHHPQHRDNRHQHPNKRARFGGGDDHTRGRYANEDIHPSSTTKRWDKNSHFRLKKLGIHVSSVPYGMTRSRENKTSWNKRTRTMNWQVEWFVHDDELTTVSAIGKSSHSKVQQPGAETAADKPAPKQQQPMRILHKMLDEVPLAEGFESSLAWFRHQQLTDEERALEKSKKKTDSSSQAKNTPTKSKAQPVTTQGQDSYSSTWSAHLSTIQSSGSGTWTSALPNSSSASSTPTMIESKYQFFYQRPRIPARQTQKLKTLNPADSLARILPGLEIVEFPAIHVFPKNMPLPKGYAIDKETEPAVRQMAFRSRQRDSTASTTDAGSGDNKKSGCGDKRKAGELVGYGSSDDDDDDNNNNNDGGEVEDKEDADEMDDDEAADTTSSSGSSSDDEEEVEDQDDLDMGGADA